LIEGELIDGLDSSSDPNNNTLKLGRRDTLDFDGEQTESGGPHRKSKQTSSKASSTAGGGSTTEDERDLEDLAKMISCFALLMPSRNSVTSVAAASSANSGATSQKDIMITAAAAASTFGLSGSKNPFALFEKFKSKSSEVAASSAAAAAAASNLNNDISMVSPGAFSFVTQMHTPKPLSEKLTMDLNELKKQYEKLKERQRQAYIIIQTASSQHRMKNNAENSSASRSNSPTSLSVKSKSSYSLNQPKLTVQSELSPFGMLEKSPVVNHLLMKSSDPATNTVKQTVQMMGGNGDTDLATGQLLREQLKKQNSLGKILIDERAASPSAQSSPPPPPPPPKKNVYYSDDDDDDDDDNESDVDSDECDQANYWSDLKRFSSNKSETAANANASPNEHRSLSLEEINRMNLIDLANLEPPASSADKNESFFKNVKANLLTPQFEGNNSSASSSSSSVSSPVLANKSAVSDEATAAAAPPSTNSKDTVRKKGSTSKQQPHQMTTSDVINNLIKEEKRNGAPLNPFPARHLNPFVAKNGLRLGLYK
jgi:hypothetical protein